MRLDKRYWFRRWTPLRSSLRGYQGKASLPPVVTDEEQLSATQAETETETGRRVMQHGTISSRPPDRFLALSNNAIQPSQTRHNPPLIVWPQEGKGCEARRRGEEGKGTALTTTTTTIGRYVATPFKMWCYISIYLSISF